MRNTLSTTGVWSIKSQFKMILTNCMGTESTIKRTTVNQHFDHKTLVRPYLETDEPEDGGTVPPPSPP
jgi:hypothetical protein